MHFSLQREISTVMSRQGFHQGIERISWIHPQPNPLGPQFFKSALKSPLATATDARWGDDRVLIP